jgi:hypothetical protein
MTRLRYFLAVLLLSGTALGATACGQQVPPGCWQDDGEIECPERDDDEGGGYEDDD